MLIFENEFFFLSFLDLNFKLDSTKYTYFELNLPYCQSQMYQVGVGL